MALLGPTRLSIFGKKSVTSTVFHSSKYQKNTHLHAPIRILLHDPFAIDKNNLQKFITNIRNWNTYCLDGRK